MKEKNKMTIDIRSIVIMLSTQAMINMGEISDPMSGEAKHDLDGAAAFIQLLTVLSEKTKGNLTPDEALFLQEMQKNLDQVFKKKINAG